MSDQKFSTCARIFVQSITSGELMLACVFKLPVSITICCAVLYAGALAIKVLEDRADEKNPFDN